MPNETNLIDSILLSVKKIGFLGASYTAFDDNITMFINSMLQILYQNGIGKNGFRVTSEADTWTDFLGEEQASELQAMATEYVGIRVRLVFDPPQSSALYQALKEEARELEWRLNVQIEPGEEL